MNPVLVVTDCWQLCFNCLLSDDKRFDLRFLFASFFMPLVIKEKEVFGQYCPV